MTNNHPSFAIKKDGEMMAFGAKIKLSVNTSGASAFRQEIQKYVNTATNDNPIVLRRFSVKVSNPKTLVNDIQRQFNSVDKGITVKIGDINAKGAISKLRAELETMLRGLTVGGMQAFMGTEGIANGIDGAIEKQRALAEAAEVVERKTINEKAALQELGRIQTTLNASFTNISKFGSTDTTALLGEYERLNTKVQELKANETVRTGEAVNGLAQEVIALKQKTQAVIEQEAATKRAATTQEASASRELSIQKQAISLHAQINRYILTNSKAYKQFGSSFDALNAQLVSGSVTSETQIKSLSTQFLSLKDVCKSAGLEGKTFFDTLKSGWVKFGGWSLVTRTMMGAYRLIKNMVTAVKELDSAMTELKKVTDLTDQAYARFLSTASKMAISVGASLSDTVNAVADFARLGFDLSESTELAEAALVYKNVGDGIENISESTESLISTMKAFGIEASDSMSIVDKFNEVGNNFAISSKGIGDALMRSASSLAAANNTLNESIALATAMNSVLQNPERVGTSLKTVSMYLRAAKTEAEEAGESTDGMANSVSELREELLTLTKGKVDIMLDDTTFKSTYQIMKELSKTWSSLADVDTANILELIGGKRNATAVASLLTNFQDAENALNSASNAANSATEENEKYLDSIAGRLDILSAKFQTFSNNLISGNLIKGIVSIGNAILTVIDAMRRWHVLLPLIIASIAALNYARLYKQAQETALQISVLTNRFIAEKTATDSLIVSYHSLSAAQQKRILNNLQEAVTSGKLTEETYAEIVAKLGLESVTKGVTAANVGLNVSIKSLLASNPIGWIMLAISALIEITSIVVNLVGNIKSTEEVIAELNEEWDELSNKITETSSAFKTLKDSANDVIPRFAELASGVDKFGKNVSLTDEEYAEFLSLNNKIAEMFPELNLGMDSNGNAMLSLSYSADTLSDSLWSLVEAQRAAANEEIADTMPEVVENITDTTEAYQKSIDSRRKALDEWNEFAEHSRDSLYQDGTKVEDRFIYKDVIAMAEKIGVEREQIQHLIEYVEDDAHSGHYNWDEVLDSAAVKNAIAGIEIEIDNFNNNINAKWKQLNPVVTAWMQTDFQFQDLESNLQQVVSNITSNIDYQSLGLKDEKDIKNYITDNIITPIHDAEPEVQNALLATFSLKELFDKGALNSGEYKTAIDTVLSKLKEAGINEETLAVLKVSIDTDDFEMKLGEVKTAVTDSKEAVNSLSSEDLEFAYQIIKAKGSMSFDELTEEIEQLKMANAPMIDILDFSDMLDNLDKAKDGLDNVISAMDKLASGTALTKSELAQLALEYPKLLEASNLFTDGSVEGQKSMLNQILEMNEQEYDAEIDKKIAELEATEQVLQDQLDLETQKANLIQEIKNLEVNGVVEQQDELFEKIKEYNNLQGKNHVTMENGILTVNQESLNKQMEQESDFGEKSTSNIWKPYGDVIKTSHTQGLSKGLAAVNVYASKLGTFFKEKIPSLWGGLSALIKDAVDPNVGIGDLSKYFGKKGTPKGNEDVPVNDVVVNFDGKVAYVDEQVLDDWVSDQENASKLRTQQTNDLLRRTINAKNNLEALKGLDLPEIYGSSGGDKDKKEKEKKETEEYIAEVEKYAEALQKLHDIEVEQSRLERELENADSATEKVEIQKRLNQVYKDRQDALHELNNLRDSTINSTIPYLQSLGFQIEYDDSTNQLLISNLEHLNELQADSVGEYEDIQEATNALRKDTEELIEDITDLNEQNEDSSKTWIELADSIVDGKEKIIEFIDEVVDEANELVDTFKDVYNTLTDAASEYASTGYLSIDTLQTILALEPKYLEFLYDENGQLILNEQSLQSVIAAKTEGMAADTALAYAKKILIAVEEDDTKSLIALTDAAKSNSNATWDAAYATLGLAKAMGVTKGMDAGYFNNAIISLTKMQSLTATAIDTIPEYYEGVKEGYVSQADGLNEIISLTQDLIKWETEQQVKALEDEKDLYGDIIERKKKSLELSKEQSDHDRSTADKIGEIAKLQSQIEQLSLDDSRETQAEKRRLEEDLSELQKDFADDQANYAHDVQIDALDEELEAYENAKDDEIKALEDNLNSTEKLYRAAIDRIKNNWNTLYDALDDWNYNYGSTLQSDLETAWNAAAAAAKRYGSAVSAITGVKDDTTVGTTDSSANTTGLINSYVRQMKYNSDAWSSADDTGKQNLSDANAELAQRIVNLGLPIVRGGNGIWYVGEVGGEKLYEKYPIYHDGGIAGGNASLEQNEVMAILEKGEVILDSNKESGLYKIIDFVEVLSDRLGKAINSTEFKAMIGGVPSLPTITSKSGLTLPTSSNTVEISPAVEVNIVHHGDMTDTDAKRYGNIAAESVLKELNSAFNKRGIGKFGGTLK